ncbi:MULTISPECIES: TonB-dependent receptor [unclassified Chryseobacterium]|uniref:TonB-dependent receptor n=1 Tax=unclassified Chryseobacterium TaxID=2593645 RepID=UPI000F50A76F|nr:MULTISPECIES: TonB-dependent receptor [unclassified Chryseobacterium]
MVFIQNCYYSQIKISGYVVNEYNKPIENVNVFIDGTLFGSSSNSKGFFSFEATSDNISYFKVIYQKDGYDNGEGEYKVKLGELDLGKMMLYKGRTTGIEGVNIVREKKSNEGQLSALNPLDLILTPNSQGDVLSAVIKSYPGVQLNPNDGRLFVRGGDQTESAVLINNMLMSSPFGTAGPSIPARSRFSPMIFSGVSFATSGFSSEYGQALSSILSLNTKSNDVDREIELSVKSVGADVSLNTKVNDNFTLMTKVEYVNLQPYRALFPSRYVWNRDYNMTGGEIAGTYKLKNGYFKSYNRFDYTNFDYQRDDIAISNKLVNTILYEGNIYSNQTINLNLNKVKFFSGIAYNYNNRNIAGIFSDQDKSKVNNNMLHIKSELSFTPIKNLNSTFGAEFLNVHYYIDYVDKNNDKNRLDRAIDNNIVSFFSDNSYKFKKGFSLNAGVRQDYYSYTRDIKISPRVRAEYKSPNGVKYSLYYGQYYQSPRNGDLVFDFKRDLKSERAEQYGLNIYYEKNNRTVFLDVFKKRYNDLTKYVYAPNSRQPINFNNNGYGYAEGIDFFFYDKKTFNNFDYRISYTYLDSKRDYQNYPESATPPFYSKHNVTVNTQFWLDAINSMVGLSYLFSSGEPYTNPNNGKGFQNSRIKPYNSVNMNLTYLFSNKFYIHASVSNIFNFKNIAGYNYGGLSSNGLREEQVILPVSDRFYFLGVFYTVGGSRSTKDKVKDL